MRLLWAVPDSTERDLGSTNPGPRIVLGGLAGGVPTPSPFLGILGVDPGARPGVGRLMPGGPSRGCWNEGRCYGNGRQGLGGGDRARAGTGGAGGGCGGAMAERGPAFCGLYDTSSLLQYCNGETPPQFRPWPRPGQDLSPSTPTSFQVPILAPS